MRRREFAKLVAVTSLWPLAARAKKAMPVIGFLFPSSRAYSAPYVAAFHEGLNEFGYIEGKNIAFEYRWAEGRYDQMSAMAAELLGSKVDLIATAGAAGMKAAHSLTTTVPIIFFGGGDLVAAGIVTSLARPGGNVTGVSIMGDEMMPKRLDLLSQLVPQTKVIALLANPTNPNVERIIEGVQKAAREKGVQLQILNASTESEIDAAFASFVQPHDRAVVVSSDPFFAGRREQIVALASRHAVPAIYEWREFSASGGLASYGPSLTGNYRLLGIYAGKILNGAKPADLPIQQPTKFELVINLKTAKALGLTVPPLILARADEVIE